MKHLPNHKAPGWDGLQYEIYKKIFPIIQIDFLNVQNCISERERLTSGMRKSVTRLPPKIKEGVPTLLQLRPISMQISDYGIRNKMLAKRLSRLMPSVLRSGHLCSHTRKTFFLALQTSSPALSMSTRTTYLQQYPATILIRHLIELLFLR